MVSLNSARDKLAEAVEELWAWLETPGDFELELADAAYDTAHVGEILLAKLDEAILLS